MNRCRLLLLLLCAAGCSRDGREPRAFGALRELAAEAPVRETYLRAHARASSELIIYQGFTTALSLRATLLTREFRQALALERERLLGPSLSTDEANAFLETQRQDAERYHEVVLAANSAQMRRDLFTADDRGWRLRLIADGTDEALLHIEHVRRPDPMQLSLFPQINRWSSLYAARFERTVSHPDRVELHVGSGYGHGTLRWDLSGGR